MKTYLVLILVIFFIHNFSNTVFCQKTSVEIVKSQKGEAVHKLLSEKTEKGLSGAIIIEHKGEVILKSGYGYANRDQKIPFTTSIISTIGSITKPLTASAIVKLQLDGKLKIDDKISKYIKNLNPKFKDITIENLLLHQSGLGSILTLSDFNNISKTDFIQRLNNKSLKFTPGAKVSYSNIGYNVLAYIIEEVTGISYENFIQNNFLMPLDMEHSGYEKYNWPTDSVAIGYKGTKQWGKVYDKIKKLDGNYWNLIGNGGIHMNINDIYKWYLAMKSNSVFTKEIITELIKPHVKCGPKSVTCFQGYAWVALYRNDGKELVAITHSGGNDILYADFWWYPKEEIFIAMLTNNSKFPAEDVLKEVKQIIRK